MSHPRPTGPYVIQSDLVGARFGEYYKKRDSANPKSTWHVNPTDATYWQTKADAQREIDRAFPSHPGAYLIIPVETAYAAHCHQTQRAHLPELSVESGVGA